MEKVRYVVIELEELYREEQAKITQLTSQMGVWSLNLAIAFDDQDWDKVSNVCGKINKAYCDLTFSKEDSDG